MLDQAMGLISATDASGETMARIQGGHILKKDMIRDSQKNLEKMNLELMNQQ